ncbi:MFS transporter [Flexivirga sp. ID2601S]|uniref:MFS transporter n=1 Tax=Flexivirga aerilata TaxID=1656889 RepID=A0A849AJQ3_9MICO|nr:MFS transporter [Flexivirga aerilata]NNG39551.1 MFS transporter [Flexivirga aerilata]
MRPVTQPPSTPTQARRVLAAAKRLIPPTPLSRRLALQSLLFATGFGTFLTGSAVYFTKLVGLSASQVGVGLSVAAVVAFLAAYPAGRVVDIIGPKRTWAVCTLVGALMFALWPFLHGFAAYLAVTVVFELVQNPGGAGRNAYILDVMPEKERVQTQAYMYSSLNVGFTLGALISGVALALDNLTVLRWMPIVTLVLGLVNAFFIVRLPRAERDVRVADKSRRKEPVPGPGALRNRGWMALNFFAGVLETNQVLLNVVIPLWLVEKTDSPHWLLAWLFGTNTVMCIFLPAYTSRGVRTIDDALKGIRISGAFFVLSCLITLLTHSTVGFLTVLLVWLGHVTVTGAELANSASEWAFQAQLMDPRRRGEYGGVGQVFKTAGDGWAPAVFTFLAISWGPAGWLVIAAIAVIATLGMAPAVRSAQRFAARELPPVATEPVG